MQKTRFFIFLKIMCIMNVFSIAGMIKLYYVWNQKLYKKQASLEYFTSKIVMYIMISYKAQKPNVVTGTKLSSYVYYDHSMTIIVSYNITISLH